jgi:hypothetical protein
MHRQRQPLIPGLFLPLICSALWPILLLTAPLACTSQTLLTVQSIIGTAPRGNIQLPSRTFSGAANCGSKVNSSHAQNNLVSITGSAGTTIDCSGTGLRCLYIANVSVVITNVIFIGNREMFPPTIIPVAPTPRAHTHSSSHDHSPPDSDFERGFASSAHRGSADSTASNKIFDYHSHPNSLFPPIGTSYQPSGDTMQTFSAHASSLAAVQNIPAAGGCILIFNSSSATVQDCSFSKCASSTVGGSAALFLVASAQFFRSKFIDSIVNVGNSAADIQSDPDNIILKSQLSGSVFGTVGTTDGFNITQTTLGYGGALFISPKEVSGILISISGCEFLRCAVLKGTDVEPTQKSIWLQGGAVAASLPFMKKSDASDQGYLLSITKSSFTQCVILHSATTLRNILDLMTGGAVSVFEIYDAFAKNDTQANDAGFVLPPNRVILQDVNLSGILIVLFIF